ncbi:MAG: hypothetical protein M9950_07435 [Thermomicrobiales bacterium]|nr:hypothetical protein [Thermomicrobiales bacterium]
MLTSDQLITKTRTIGSPRISPDGKHIVYILGYIEAESPRSSLWMMNADGSENRQITFQAEKVGWPAWSPDSATIAFVASYDGKHHLSTLALDGGEARPLSEHVESPAGLAWSPDGRTIAYTMRVNPDANDEDSATPRFASLDASITSRMARVISTTLAINCLWSMSNPALPASLPASTRITRSRSGVRMAIASS